jgi:hypothetical protein
MATISPLRQRMIEDMTVRNLSPATRVHSPARRRGSYVAARGAGAAAGDAGDRIP